MTKRSAARKARDASGYTAQKTQAKITHDQMEEHAIKVLSKLRPGLSYPQLVAWVNGMDKKEMDAMRTHVLSQLGRPS